MLRSSFARRGTATVAAALVLVLPILASGLAGPAPARAATHVVSIVDGGFVPASLSIAVGDTVTWRNDDDSPHTVTSDDGAFDSGNLDPGQSFTLTFSAERSTGYVCLYHDEMTGTLTIAAASAPAAAAPAAPAATTAAGGTAVAGDEAAPEGPHEGATHQPDTALPLGATPQWLATLLIGLGLVAFAWALVPGRPRVPAPAEPPTRVRGWRR
jgi:plastocyanin